ncbi:xylose isomerase-like protein [Fomes fomentarius]|nr:xylose isomerase-like protein [Fomes fomentarius]
MTLRRSARLSVAISSAPTASANQSAARSISLSTLSSVSNSTPELDVNPRPTKRVRIARPSTAAVDAREEEEPAPVKKSRRKPKAEVPEPTVDDFTPRVINTWKIGPHVSSAGGVEHAITNAASVGANAFALFLKSQRKWDSNALKGDSITKFKDRMKLFGYSPSHILPHGSYLVNLGNPDEEKREKSYKCFLDDLKRCEQLGLQLYNFHPGSTVGVATMKESIALIAECINRAHKETESVVIVLENMAGSGNVIGSRFSELGEIIKQVVDKTRVGVCLDTCDVTWGRILMKSLSSATMAEFDRDVGIFYLKGMHLNDSKGALGSKKDRHENIGLGHLGLRTFAHILSDPRTCDIPLVLETPAYDVPSTSGSSAAARDRLAKEGMGVWRTEVSVLNRLSGRPRAGQSGSTEGDNGEDGVIGDANEDAKGRLEESELEDFKAEIADAVENASKLKDGKGKKQGGGKGQGAKRKAKRKAGKEEEEEEEDGDSCCDLEQ